MVTTLLWSFAVFLASVFAAVLSMTTLKPRFGRWMSTLLWLVAGAVGFAAAYYFYSLNLFDDTFGILGLSAIVCIATYFFCEGTWSSKFFVSLTSCLIANVCTFMFCGTTDQLLAPKLGLITTSPYDTPNLLFFIGIKVVVYSVMFVVYRLFLHKKVDDMILALSGKMAGFIAAPAVSVIGFYVINLFTNQKGIFPNDKWFFPLYLAVCLIFVIEFWLIFYSVLQSSRAMKNEAELGVATHIQQSMLPSIFPAFPDHPEFDVYATMDPAKEVGGDFYDFFLVDNDHLALVVADVSGKGVPAALFMMISKNLIKNAAEAGLSPKDILGKVNNQLCENNEAEMFVTVWLGIIEISTGKMICANAGHEYPAICRKDGAFELFKDKHGMVLAGMENAKYREYELQINPGDRLFVYTDGVAEATDANIVLYGTDRMLNALNKKECPNCQAVLEALAEDIDLFVGKAPQFDDITMLCFEMRDKEAAE